MNLSDIKELMAGIAPVLREQIDAAVKPYADRVGDLERQLAARPAAISAETVEAMIAEAFKAQPAPEAVLTDDLLNTISAQAHQSAQAAAKTAAELALANLPAPKDGEPGADADPEVIRRMVVETVEAMAPTLKGEPGKDVDPDAVDLVLAQAIARIPTPKDGASVTIEDVAPLISEAVEKAVAAIPVPRDGEPGKDGAALVEAMLDADGALVLVLNDGRIKNLGRVVGKDGEPGKQGDSGFGLDDFDIERPDYRTLRFKFSRGDVENVFDFNLEHPIYRGVFKAGETYTLGDMATWAGSLWHCEVETTTDKPGEGSASWALVAKKGRDGKDLAK